MSAQVEFPEMRGYVIEALQSLSDVDHQRLVWGKFEEGASYYDDLSLDIALLYDDTMVIPDPASSVGSVLFAEDAPGLQALYEVLDPLIDKLGDQADEVYTADPQWPAVVDAAKRALDVMEANDHALS